jgi:hypothetical protein
VPAFRVAPKSAGSAGPAPGSAGRRHEPAAAGPGSEVGNLLQEAEDKLAKIAELRRHQRGIEAAVARLRGELAGLFDAGGTETFELPAGRLRRLRRKDGEGWDFVIEV